YNFFVSAVYHLTSNSSVVVETSQSASVQGTPGVKIQQTITADKPAGQLVISQYCEAIDTGWPNHGPYNAAGVVDPSNSQELAIPVTNCNVDLSGPRTSNIKTNAVTAWARSVTDALTNGTTTIASVDAAFTGNDVNQLVSGDGITPGTRIASVAD